MLVCCSTATGALDFQVGCPDASALISDRDSADNAVTLIPPPGGPPPAVRQGVGRAASLQWAGQGSTRANY